MTIDLNASQPVLITGSSKGLGLELGSIFLNDGHPVVFHSRNSTGFLADTNIHSKSALEISCELENYNETKNCLTDLFHTEFKPNLIICNAGSSSFATGSEIDIKTWHKAFNDNFYSALNIINISKEIYALNSSEASAPLNIICISSICGSEKIAGAPMQYSIAKSALNNMIKFYAKDVVKDNIILNAIATGNLMFPGSLWENKFKSKSDKENFLKNIPSRRFVETSEIYEAIKIITSPRMHSLIGQVITVDGGQTISF